MPAWEIVVARLLLVKEQLRLVDRRGRYPYRRPEAPAAPGRLAAAEAVLGRALDADYRAFLACADGWAHVYGRVHLFGTRDLLGSPAMTAARQRLAVLERTGALRAAGVRRADLLPIAAGDLDLFAQTPAGTVIWFARDEIERYPDFPAFAATLLELNRDIITLFRADARFTPVVEMVLDF
jgi:hypothetical protein